MRLAIRWRLGIHSPVYMRAKAIGEGGEGTRQRILAAAYALFYRHGFVRVGLDDIAAKAGVTKRTLYYHFRSKDDLLAAAMTAHSELALARIRQWGDKLPADPLEAIDALFEQLGRWASSPNFEGAGYTRLVMELADLPGHPARTVARQHKVVVEVWLADQLAARGVANANECARRITVLMEGAGASMLIHGDRSYVRAAAEMGRKVVSGWQARTIEAAHRYVFFLSRIASVLSRSALSRIKPSASFWS
jgi:AcrR family transcriptional regulator